MKSALLLLSYLLATSLSGCQSSAPAVRFAEPAVDQVVSALQSEEPSVLSENTIAVGVLFRCPDSPSVGYSAYVEVWNESREVSTFIHRFQPGDSPGIQELLSKEIVFGAQQGSWSGLISSERQVGGLLSITGDLGESQLTPRPWVKERRDFLQRPLGPEALALFLYRRSPPDSSRAGAQ
jgi:hypothetical protein